MRGPKPAILCLLPQSPLDTASGAAVSERTTCEMLARAGWRVTIIAPTSSEASRELDARCSIARFGIADIHSSAGPSGETRLSFRHRDVNYRLLDTGSQTVNDARRNSIDALDAMVAEEFHSGAPNLVLTYGSSEAEVRRRARAREAGSRIVFSVHNLAYTHPRAFESVDAIIGPSQYASDFYRRNMNVQVTALPQPVSPSDAVALVTNPAFVTFINPTPAKGVHFFVRIVKEVASQGLDLPFLVVESRGSAGLLAKVAEVESLDMKSVENLYVARNTADPASVYAVTRMLLMPSLNEAAGRSVVEAQLNGIPVLASDRGGLPETVGKGGFVLPVCDGSTEPGERHVKEWLELIVRLQHDPVLYQQASAASYAAASVYRSGEVERDRVAFFASQLRS